MRVATEAEHRGALEYRARLTALLKEGQDQVSGYARELFVGSMKRRINEVTETIQQFEQQQLRGSVSCTGFWLREILIRERQIPDTEPSFLLNAAPRVARGSLSNVLEWVGQPALFPEVTQDEPQLVLA